MTVAPTADPPMPATLLDQLTHDERWVSSVIRDLLVHARQPGILSLAGGLPASELLPSERCQVAAERVLIERGGVALQYGLTPGEPELRERLVRPEAADVERILVTAGSQQALDLVARLTATDGTSPSVVVIEDPGYIGASQIFRSHRHQLVGIPVDTDGLCVEVLGERLEAGLRPRLCYVNPTFQNPTGASLSAERGRRLVELAETYDFLIIADDPYVELALGESRAASALPSSRQLVRLGSMSKTLSPGLRVGWLDADPALVAQLTLVKQAADLHTATFNQLLVAELMSDDAWWESHLAALRDRYRTRRDALRSALALHLPQAQLTPQEGGFFLWCDLGVDVRALLPEALVNGVAFVPGAAFAIDRPAATSIRLSYSSGDPGDYAEATRRLAVALESISGHRSTQER